MIKSQRENITRRVQNQEEILKKKVKTPRGDVQPTKVEKGNTSYMP
jgi:hypothetical protein